MYKEKINDDMAQIILEDKYVAGLRYDLISDRDKFVLVGYDSKGSRVVEMALDSDDPVTDDNYLDEFDALKETPKPKRVFPFGSVITIFLFATCIAILAIVGLYLYMRR